MPLTNNQKIKDKIFWRCTKKENNSQDVKINIRNRSIFSQMKCDLRILYFIIFNNFTKNNIVNAKFRNCKEFYKDLKLENISKPYIGKIFNIIKHKIMVNTHAYWSNHYIRVLSLELMETKMMNLRLIYLIIMQDGYLAL